MVRQSLERESGSYSRTGTWILYGDMREVGDASASPGKSSLFFLTLDCPTLESDYQEIGLRGWESTQLLAVSGALSTALENPTDRFIRTPGRTHNRIRSPR